MRLTYKRTFSQFIDNYLSSYYSAGVQMMRRLLGGPVLMVLGAIIFFAARDPETLTFFRVLGYLAGAALFLFGLFSTLRPFLNILLVWLRKDQFLGAEGQEVSVAISDDGLAVSDADGEALIPFKDILSIQRRADSAWIITRSDHLVYVPRKELTSGDPDAFLAQLDLILNPPEEG